MAYYTNEYSNFPHELMPLHHFKDVDDSVGSLVNQIKILQSQGKYDKVNEIIQLNKDTLGQYCFGAELINRLDEEIRNLEIYAIYKRQNIYYTEQEPELVENFDVWIGGSDDILT